jgi:hypothetical protein
MNVSVLLVMLVILLSLHQMSIISTYIESSLIVVLRVFCCIRIGLQIQEPAAVVTQKENLPENLALLIKR